MSENWDVESYRMEFESDEHWELKKSFMLAHKDRIPENELVCLAQAFINIEILGCRYPEETMKKVAELAKGLVEPFREKKKDRLKRTFVAATDAAVAKFKGLGFQSETSSNNKKFKTEKNFGEFKKWGKRDIGTFKSCPLNPPGSDSIKLTGLKQLEGPLAWFVLFLYDQDPISLLERNVSLNKGSLRWEFHTEKNFQICSIYINDEFLARSEGPNKKICKDTAAKLAIDKLQNLCYTIRVKTPFDSTSSVSPADLECGLKLNAPEIGEKIMKLMGWAGGGLGVKQQGIIEPVSLLNNSKRKGLGLLGADAHNFEFRNQAKALIENWMKSDTNEDLTFSSDFNNIQRKMLHKIALKYDLMSKSYGQGVDRHLVISKKLTPLLMVEKLLQAGGSSSNLKHILKSSTDLPHFEKLKRPRMKSVNKHHRVGYSQ